MPGCPMVRIIQGSTIIPSLSLYRLTLLDFAGIPTNNVRVIHVFRWKDIRRASLSMIESLHIGQLLLGNYFGQFRPKQKVDTVHGQSFRWRVHPPAFEDLLAAMRPSGADPRPIAAVNDLLDKGTVSMESLIRPLGGEHFPKDHCKRVHVATFFVRLPPSYFRGHVA